MEGDLTKKHVLTNFFVLTKKSARNFVGFGCSTVVECLPSRCKEGLEDDLQNYKKEGGGGKDRPNT